MKSLTWWDRLVGFFSPRALAARARYRAQAGLMDDYLRKFEGASRTRRTAHWKTSGTSANAEVESSLKTLRDRSRSLVRDNPYAAKALQVITSNVVGKGIFTQVKVDSGQRNRESNRFSRTREETLAKTWKAWANNVTIDYDERHDICGIQRLIMRSVVESGEVLIRLRRTGPRVIRTSDGIEIPVPPIQLQVLESDFLDLNNTASSPV